jgi:SAM-dependent methyltransferase
MQEILDHLTPCARVLDLGCKGGSFRAQDYPHLQLIAADLCRPRAAEAGFAFVQADAAGLPFRSRSFDAVLLNHSLEHFEKLKPALQELGRIVKADGAVYVSVPDATTFSDRLYRRVFRERGGHVNLFASRTELVDMLSWYTGLRPAGARQLHASFTFLNRRAAPPSSRQTPFTRFPETLLRTLTRVLRMADRRIGSRLSVYGWALYFGNLRETVDEAVRWNICIRCGQSHPANWLLKLGVVHRGGLLDSFTCPACGAKNCFTSDYSIR